jgi:hypothetical protein
MECGPLVVSPPTTNGYGAGQYSLRYATNLKGCKTAEMQCINPKTQQTSSIVGITSAGLQTIIDTETNPLYSVAEFICLDSGQYAYTAFYDYFSYNPSKQIVFDTITCQIPGKFIAWRDDRCYKF